MSLPTIVTLEQRPDLEKKIHRIDPKAWPAFMLHDSTAEKYWIKLHKVFPEYQFALCEGFNEVVATGHSIPICWDGTIKNLPESWDVVLEKGFLDQERNRDINTLAALSIAVSPERQGRGLSGIVLSAMKSIGVKHGLKELIAPIRPTRKSHYPHVPMEKYIQWKTDDGAPFDPWLRLHWRQGAEIVKVALKSLVITGTIADWEEWTGMKFPESGEYVIPGALQPVIINCEEDFGLYEDPCVWIRCKISGEKKL